VVWLAGCGAGLAAGPPERPAARRVGAPPGAPDESVRPSGGTGARLRASLTPATGRPAFPLEWGEGMTPRPWGCRNRPGRARPPIGPRPPGRKRDVARPRGTSAWSDRAAGRRRPPSCGARRRGPL